MSLRSLPRPIINAIESPKYWVKALRYIGGLDAAKKQQLENKLHGVCRKCKNPERTFSSGAKNCKSCPVRGIKKAVIREKAKPGHFNRQAAIEAKTNKELFRPSNER